MVGGLENDLVVLSQIFIRCKAALTGSKKLYIASHPEEVIGVLIYFFYKK